MLSQKIFEFIDSTAIGIEFGSEQDWAKGEPNNEEIRCFWNAKALLQHVYDACLKELQNGELTQVEFEMKLTWEVLSVLSPAIDYDTAWYGQRLIVDMIFQFQQNSTSFTRFVPTATFGIVEDFRVSAHKSMCANPRSESYRKAVAKFDLACLFTDYVRDCGDSGSEDIDMPPLKAQNDFQYALLQSLWSAFIYRTNGGYSFEEKIDFIFELFLLGRVEGDVMTPITFDSIGMR